MSAQPSLGGDELRARAYLRALSARPFGHQEPAVNEPRPVTPTRIIPAGAPLPERPPEHDEIPPWWQKPEPPPPAAPPPPPARIDPEPGPVEVRHTHEITLTWATPDPEPSRWERLTGWFGRYVRPWHAVIGITAAVVPIPGVGYSAATVWNYTVGLGRESFGVGWGYALGLIPLLLAVTVIARHGGSPLRLFALAVTLVGALASFSWYDPIQFLTGVSR
ncbi:hypothetical protein [Streptomyces olivaceus]|uniref:hypothetical protein n=1 Tax=Streptomyces olivaceus TaxID=47716 RepID=UPI0022EE81BD|nr:hypothetical protein [Streptomyces olivaceus]GHI91725.1 hypothetical protein TPA0905_11960 [Streptomyces olivaceus]